jgi:riboflavin biosynthesis pyrimidine reductase
VASLLIEGGARLNYAALEEGLVDEIHLTLAPFVSGDRDSAALADGPRPLGDPFLALELVSSEPLASGELFLHYRVPKTT